MSGQIDPNNKIPPFDEIANNKRDNSKENNKPNIENVGKNNKNNKNLFLVNRTQNTDDNNKSEKINNLVNNKKIDEINDKQNINRTQEINNMNRNEENYNNNVNEMKGNICKDKTEEIYFKSNKEEANIDDNNIRKTTINNNFIIKDNPFMINTNLTNSNIINNNVENSTVNNNYSFGNYPPNNKNGNIINNINYDLNNNYINELVYKDNNLNRNNIQDKNNIINNIRFMRGRSAQPKTNINSFLNGRHHLLENAIINKEFQEPKRKVILKNERYPGSNSDPNNNEYFNKIIDLEESDSENYFNNDENEEDDEFSQEFDEEDDDEEYNINVKDENWINNNSKNKKKNYSPKNKNTELDTPLYNEINELIKKNGFDTIIECLYKIYDNEVNTKGNQNQNELIKKLNDILYKSNKDTINIILIKILSNNYNESQIKLYDLISKSNLPKPIEIKDNSRERNQKRGKSQNLVQFNGKIKEKRKHTKRPSPPFYYGKHYFKKNNRIYVYVPKAKTVSMKRNTLYCIYRGSKDKCMAKIIVHQKDNKITYIGSHICHPKMTLEDFNKKFPNIEKPNWTHIQFAVNHGKPYILSQY